MNILSGPLFGPCPRSMEKEDWFIREGILPRKEAGEELKSKHDKNGKTGKSL